MNITFWNFTTAWITLDSPLVKRWTILSIKNIASCFTSWRRLTILGNEEVVGKCQNRFEIKLKLYSQKLRRSSYQSFLLIIAFFNDPKVESKNESLLQRN